jgi:hypothetical protein
VYWVTALTQEKYAIELVEKVSMTKCISSPTPLSSSENLSLMMEHLLVQMTAQYMSIVGELQYLTLTRPDISYPVFPCFYYFTSKRIIRYVKGTLIVGITFQKSTSSLLNAFSNAD